jgi:ABC-type nickel/cobalt efflux system permease component RcnA
MDWQARLISNVVEVVCGVGTVFTLVLANTAANVPPQWVAVANLGFAVFFGVWVLTRTLPQQDKRHQSTIQAMLKTFADESKAQRDAHAEIAKADRATHAATIEKIERRHDEQLGQLYDRIDRQSTQFLDALDRVADQLAQVKK